MGRVNLHRDPLRPLFQLLEGSGQRLAGTEQAGTRPVGLELPATGSDICNGSAATGVKMAMACGQGGSAPARTRSAQIPRRQGEMERSTAVAASVERVSDTDLGPAISRFPVPELDQLPDDVRARIEAVSAKSGFVPNVFLVLAHRPEEFRAFMAYHDALMERESGLTKGERELIVVATSARNECQYCVVAHGAIARIRMKNPLIADQVAINHRKADLSARQLAMLAFAVKMAEQAQGVSDDDLDVLRSHGFSDEDIWDIGAITAFFALSNRMASLTAMRPNVEFYAMGR